MHTHLMNEGCVKNALNYEIGMWNSYIISKNIDARDS